MDETTHSALFSEAWLEGHLVDVSGLRRSDIVGIGHVLREADSLIARLRDPARAAAMGVEPPRGILLWGEPGLGKTLVARFLAASLGSDGEGENGNKVPFYEVSADELTPDRIRGALIYLADRHPRSVLYIDECDTFGMAREDWHSHDSGTRLLLTATLAALDGIRTTAGPIVVASSNSAPGFLDRALVRAGRLGFKIRFDAPDEDERVELFALFTKSIPCEPAIDWRHAARLTLGKTPADIRQLVSDAGAIALEADRDIVAGQDVIDAIRRDGRIEPEDAIDLASLHRIGIHEAGHVAVAEALRSGWVYSVRIGPGGGATAFGKEGIPNDWRPDDEGRDALVVSFGGLAAEIGLLSEGSLGGRSDASAATDIALDRITAGLHGEPVPVDLGFLGVNVGDSLKDAYTEALVDQLRAARILATAIVAANLEPIRQFAAVLESAGELSGDALRDAIADAGFAGADQAVA